MRSRCRRGYIASPHGTALHCPAVVAAAAAAATFRRQRNLSLIISPSPLSHLPLSSHPSFLPSASAVSRRRTRISLDLLNTAMTALPTPSIVSHSYFTLPRKGLRKFGSWTMHILENLHLSRHYNFGFIPNCSNAYVVTAKNGCCNLQLNVQIHRDRQKGFPQVP